MRWYLLGGGCGKGYSSGGGGGGWGGEAPPGEGVVLRGQAWGGGGGGGGGAKLLQAQRLFSSVMLWCDDETSLPVDQWTKLRQPRQLPASSQLSC